MRNCGLTNPPATSYAPPRATGHRSGDVLCAHNSVRMWTTEPHRGDQLCVELATTAPPDLKQVKQRRRQGCDPSRSPSIGAGNAGLDARDRYSSSDASHPLDSDRDRLCEGRAST